MKKELNANEIPETPAGYIAVKWEEYKELLIIKGKYEELSKIYPPLIINTGFKEDGTTILPLKDLQTVDPILQPPWKITCGGELKWKKI